MREPNESINLVVSHQEQVVVLPKGAELIAGSDFCPNSIFAVGDHMLGIQGHPEFTTAYSRALMELRRDIIPAPRIEQGMNSLSLSVDGARAFDWIVSLSVRELSPRRQPERCTRISLSNLALICLNGRFPGASLGLPDHVGLRGKLR
jgi:GMP synthase (glutamine-hydrolysing)